MVFYYHRPLSTMYSDNYRYGSSLSAVDDVEWKYRTTLSRTSLRSDRGDLGLYSFAGSNLHGGTPAAEKIPGTKVTIPDTKNQDLYAPLNFGYGRKYYNYLRATSPEPRTRSRKKVASFTIPEDLEYQTAPSCKFGTEYDYKTLPTKVSTDYDSDRKKTTTKTTTTTETWVPLTTYIYQTPYHSYYYKSTPFSSYTYRSADDLYSYNYVDDYKRYATTTTSKTTKNIDALDLSTSKSYESSFDYKHSSEKCHEIQSQLDQVNKWVADAESKIKSELVTSRSKMQTELAEVAMVVEDTAKYNDELHRAIRKQAKQISTLSSQYEDINRNIADVVDVLDKSKSRCVTLQSELSSVQTGLEMAAKRRI